MQQFSIAVIIALLLAVSGCGKNRCEGDDETSGIIRSSIRVSCLPTVEGNRFLIVDDSTYQATFLNAVTGQPTCELPAIDFASESLLGLYGDGACNVRYEREVTRDESNRQYHYHLTVFACGNCESLGFSYNWVTVPQLPAGWTVRYEVTEK